MKRKHSRLWLIDLGWFAVLTSIFALVYTQAPLYTSNQNQYFLHGFARAGVGTLPEDWLANTADPTPVFTSLVLLVMRLFHNANVFFVFYALMMGIYLFSLIGIIEQVFPVRNTKLTRLVFIAVVLFLHSTLLRHILLRIAGPNWSYLFEGGFAGQRLLGTVFQPSTFGVFLLLSIYLYLKDHRTLAVLSAVLAATFHPTYLLSGGALTLAYLIDIYRRQKSLGAVLRLGSVGLAAVAPILVYTLIQFWGGDAGLKAEAQDILVNIRLPLHARVWVWFNASTVVGLVFLGLGLFLARHHRLFWILFIPCILGMGMTLVQIITKNNALALIFPWRISTWLIPVSVGLISAWAVVLVIPRIPAALEQPLRVAGLAVIAFLLAAGMVRIYLEENEAANLPFRPVEAYIASHRQPGQQYLVPFNIYDFRLESGAPNYGDFLSIPYQNSEVLEWYRRFSAANLFFQRGECEQLGSLVEEGVTHVILAADDSIQCPTMERIYSDPSYNLFRLIPEE